jgi:hypothetical protein
MGNSFAYAALILWPLLTVYWFVTKKTQVAVIITILGGFMFLPVGTVIDLPLFPAMGQQTLPVLCAILGCMLIKKQRIIYFSGLGRLKYLVLLFVLVPFITALLNPDSFVIGGRYLPGLTLYDGLSFGINQFLIISPFFIGRQFFQSYNDQVTMFKLLVLAGLFYSVLMLFEVRMSPQLHTWVYGYFPHSFLQQYRFGGFRPVVFMGHGLLVAFFTVVVLISALSLWNVKEKITYFTSRFSSYYLLIVLVFCKSLATLFYGFSAFIALRFTKPKMQFRAALFLAVMTLFYPVMSIMDIFPHDTVVELAREIDDGRAQSIAFRFENEKVLLDHGREKMLFGWGGWGRNRVYNQETGIDETVTDGKWILTFGQFGLFGFFAEFGLLGFTIFGAYRAFKVLGDEKERSLLAGHALLVGIVMLDQLPNASLAPWVWLLVGILSGRSREVVSNKFRQREVS